MPAAPRSSPKGIDLGLYVLLDPWHTCGRDLPSVAREAVDGGATVLQLRLKGAGGKEYVQAAEQLVELCAGRGVPLIVNDRADVAAAAGAAGAHLGQDDLPISLARAVFGPGMLLGASCDTLAEVEAAARDGADYAGLGPVFPTSSKADAGPVLGLDGCAAVAAEAPIPVVAIGGIGPDNAEAVIRAGAAGVAVLSAVCAAASVRAACEALREAVERGRAGRG